MNVKNPTEEEEKLLHTLKLMEDFFELNQFDDSEVVTACMHMIVKCEKKLSYRDIEEWFMLLWNERKWI